MGGAEVPEWLKSLPLAPEYRPTESEFADPIAFISRIEEEAAGYGICKVIPPIPKPSKKFVFHNLNRSLSKSPELGDVADSRNPRRAPGDALFTTRHQELGSRRTRLAVHKQVWQSGELYTVDQFEAKSKLFSRSLLGGTKCENPDLVEAKFWKSAEEKPIYVEYANDVPGSGFCSPTEAICEGSAGWKLSNSPWNLQSIAKSPGSLTRFMPDEVPGVTSPMVYIGMLFSWFAWHVEDHELHSLNFLHTGSPKTWYAVPGSYAAKFEEAVRIHGYGGHVDRIVSFTLLGEKTTLLSPEVVAQAGIPCCRLVQNPGEFVVTFPRAYHVGFSHGFNCGEAANFATPRWLHVAKEAAVRRAIMDHLPMLSHQQLLYMLAMSFISRVPEAFLPGQWSTRLKDSHEEERESLVKRAFLDDLANELRLVNALLVNDPESHVALWHPDLLPPPTDSPQKSIPVNRFNEVDFFGMDGKLPFDLDVESGTLTCTACGILGYPFMAIMQPNKKSTIESKSTDDLGLTDWDMLDQSLRPRIFCLEHALEVCKLLQLDRVTTRVLVICHSDYLKIRSYAAAVAKQVNDNASPEDDLRLQNADQGELTLVNISIDEEGEIEKMQDWTSEMGFNLRNCVRLKKESPTNNQHLRLDLGSCFSNEEQVQWPDASALKWLSRRTRSQLGSKELHPPIKKRDSPVGKNSNEDSAAMPCNPPAVAEEFPETTAPQVSISPIKHYERRKKKDLRPEEKNPGFSDFVRSPCEGLRPRTKSAVPPPEKPSSVSAKHKCKIQACGMEFQTEKELRLHGKNRCTVEGCGKRFGSHKYAVRHQCVHEDERPLKCLWEGCEMRFKWAWARTEHLRVHTGERPYQCRVNGCGRTFRFVSDFSRHRRRMGHCSNGG